MFLCYLPAHMTIPCLCNFKWSPTFDCIKALCSMSLLDNTLALENSNPNPYFIFTIITNKHQGIHPSIAQTLSNHFSHQDFLRSNLLTRTLCTKPNPLLNGEPTQIFKMQGYTIAITSQLLYLLLQLELPCT